jgi:hypothetical protein
VTDKELHRNTLIFAAIVIVALFLWAYFHGQLQAALNPFNPPSTVNQNPGVSFDIQGQPTVTGPINFPQAVYDIPSGPPNGVYNPSSCNCGCSGGMNGGAVTYSFPDTTSYYTALQTSENNALTAMLNSITGAMPYSEQVMVTNNTPTPWA